MATRWVLEVANRNRLPAMYPYRDYVEADGLMAYKADVGEAGRRAGCHPRHRPTTPLVVFRIDTS